MTPGPIQTLVAARIGQERVQQGLTVVETCRRLETAGFPFPRWSWYKLERGDRRISIDEFVAIARILGMNPIEILADALNQIRTETEPQ